MNVIIEYLYAVYKGPFKLWLQIYHFATSNFKLIKERMKKQKEYK